MVGIFATREGVRGWRFNSDYVGNMSRSHSYSVTIDWTGNLGSGTSGYTAYRRDYRVSAAGKPPIAGSSDPAFRGDGARWNPEDLLVASLSACHQLWYLHLCAVNNITVLAYHDDASGTMVEGRGEIARFSQVVLRPRVTVSPGDDVARAEALHHDAHTECFIANSVNFAVDIAPVMVVAG